MKTQLITIQASDAPPEYRDALILVMEMRVTLSAIASFITTREAASPVADKWIKERLEYVEAKLEAANEEMA